MKWILSLLFLTVAVHAVNIHRGGRHPFDHYEHLYDPNDLVTIEGPIIHMHRFAPTRRTGYTVHVLIRHRGRDIDVFLAPHWYLAERGIELHDGDEIRVLGSPLVVRGLPILIAKELRINGKWIPLRDDEGFPFWGPEAQEFP